jgi:hypothetical protein
MQTAKIFEHSCFIEGVSKVKLNLSSVSRACERNVPSADTTVCGMSSLFSHTTVVPTGTVMVPGFAVGDGERLSALLHRDGGNAGHTA